MKLALDKARGRHVLAALSGGADSVALLHILCRARDEGILSVTAAHFEHGIRGKDSLDDADFCRELCRKLDVQFILGRAPVPEIARRTGEGLETCARRLRHGFLNETADILGADLIALAHHMDDQAETVLMHLLRGAGPEGITGMRVVSGRLFRPLINVRKVELVAYLEKLGETWREDATNMITDNPRNHLRLEAIPAMERAYPGAVSAIARYASSAALESGFMDQLTDEFLEKRVEKLPIGWRVDAFGNCPEALLRRALRRLLGRDLDSQGLDALIGLETACDVFGGISARRAGDNLYVILPWERPRAELFRPEGVTSLEGICRLTSEKWENAPEKKLKSTQVLDRKSLEGAVLRTRAEGDRIAPLGMKGTKSLSDYFTDLKVDRPLRDMVPLLARGSDVLWAVGYGISRDCALKDGGDAVRIVCEYIGWGGFKP